MTTSTGLQPDPGAPGAVAPAPADKKSRHIVRRTVTWILVVLFALLTPITLTSAWAVKTVTNTDRYVATLQPLAEDPVVTNYIADRATNELFDQLDVQKQIAGVLPKAGAAIAAPLTAQLKTYTDAQMRKLLSSQWFRDFWKKENTYTQGTAVAILTGKNPPPVSKTRAVVIGLSPVLIQAIDDLNAKGVTVFNPIRDELKTNQTLTLKLYSNKQVKMVQKYFNLAISLRVLLLIVTPLIGLAAIACSVDRRRGAIRTLLGGIAGILVLYAGLTWLRNEFISAAPVDAQMFAQHLWDAMLRFLRSTMNLTLFLFVAAVLVLWLMGNSPWAVAVRRTVGGGSKKLGDKATDIYRSEATAKAIAKAGDVVSRSSAYVQANLVSMRWAGVVVAAVFLFFTSSTSGLVWILILLAIYQAVISFPWTRKSATKELGENDESKAELTSSEAASD